MSDYAYDDQLDYGDPEGYVADDGDDGYAADVETMAAMQEWQAERERAIAEAFDERLADAEGALGP